MFPFHLDVIARLLTGLETRRFGILLFHIRSGAEILGDVRYSCREEEQVPQFHGRIDEKFAEWETDVRLWQVEFKLEDRDRMGPRLYRRGLHGQPKIIVKTKLGTQDVSQFTVDNIIQCLKDNGYGELPEELGQEALDNYVDMREGKAESILDYIFREEILTDALKKETAIDLDEKIRGYLLMRTSNLTEREVSGIKIITQGQTQLAQVKKGHPDKCCKET